MADTPDRRSLPRSVHRTGLHDERGGRPGVDVGRGEAGNGVDESLLGVVGDVVGLDQAQVPGDGDGGVGAQGVPDPAQPQIGDVADATG